MADYAFKKDKIWIQARSYAKRIWSLTLNAPFSKDFELKDQIRASSGSIMDNYAEGSERDGNREFIQFLSVSKASAAESLSQLHRAFDRSYISDKDLSELNHEAVEIGRMIGGLIKYLKNDGRRGNKF
jgi:four helix bundle protein